MPSWRTLCVSLGLLSLLFCQQRTATAIQPPCLPDFSYQQGWLGADAAYSVPLDEKRSLWLFGDTFIGPGPDRRGTTMIANSLAISTCGPQGFALSYFWNTDTQQQPTAFFAPASPPAQQGVHPPKYWPLHGFLADGKLYLALEEIASEPTTPDNPFGFAIVGVTLAEIANPHADPNQWKVRYLPLLQSRRLVPGAAMVLQGKWVYLFSFLETPDKQHPLLLNRLLLSSLQSAHPQPEQAIEYLAQDGRWKPGFEGPDSKILVKQAATELSVHYDKQSQKWLMLHTSPQFFSPEVVLLQADSLTGPWQQAKSQPFYQEMLPESPIYDKETFCYAAKAHPQFSTADHGLVVTYACNSLSFDKLLGNMQIYWPVIKELSP